jgi:DNA-binding transcriptional regulator GbsR (MarR family)
VKAPSNIVELRVALAETLRDLRSGDLDRHVAGEVANMAGKITNTLKVQLDYAELRKEKPEVAYLNG